MSLIGRFYGGVIVVYVMK